MAATAPEEGTEELPQFRVDSWEHSSQEEELHQSGINLGVGQNNGTQDFKPKRTPLERKSQEEQTGANFSFIAPSSEEL